MKAKDLASAFVAGTMTLEAVFLALASDARDLIKNRKCSVPAAVHSCWEEQMQKFSSFCRLVGEQAEVTQDFESWLRASGFAPGLFQERDRKAFKARELVHTAIKQFAVVQSHLKSTIATVQGVLLEVLASESLKEDNPLYVEQQVWKLDDCAPLPMGTGFSVREAVSRFIVGLANDLLRMPDFADAREYAYREMHRWFLTATIEACRELQAESPKLCISMSRVRANYIAVFYADQNFQAWVRPVLIAEGVPNEKV